MAPDRSAEPHDRITLEKIKEEYIYGTITDEGREIYLSYKKLSECYGYSLDVIKKAGKKERWPKLREQNRTDTALKTAEGKSSFKARKIIQSDDKFEDTFELGRIIGKMVLERNKKYLEADEKHFISGTQFKHTIDGIRGCQEGIKTSQGEITQRIEVKDVNVYDKIREREEQYNKLNSVPESSD
jgi:hypothetical protein